MHLANCHANIHAYTNSYGYVYTNTNRYCSSEPNTYTNGRAIPYFYSNSCSAYSHQLRWPNVPGQRGQLWSADMDFVGGSTFSTTHSITGTSDPTLYQTERYAPTLTYNIPVVNDTYTVTLYFAEIYFDAPGQRVFNVSIEGQTVLQNFDIWAVAGQFAAVQRTFVVTVTDGVLNIVATASVNNAKFSAIQVVPGSPAPTPTPTATATTTVTPTPTSTPTPSQCEVPNFIGTRLHDAQSTWNDAGFTTQVILPGFGNMYISWQSLPEGFIGSCSETTITVQ